MSPLTLSVYEVEPLFAAHRAGQSRAPSSPDLRRNACEVELNEEGVRFPSGFLVSWSVLEHIQQNPTQCFAVDEAGAEPIREFSEETGWVRTLFPTEGWPTTIVAGFTMHRIQGIDPKQDTERKVKPLLPVQGEVLDTATGLGYTAILLRRHASRVITVERDPAALRLARRNPWSQELFQGNIELREGDIAEEIANFTPGSLGAILHDPPTMRLAGELYSGAFYQALHKALRPSGKLFHYIGNPDSKSGATVTKGAIQRLQAAGFRKILPRPEAFGVLASK
jgi:hypothetical protein